MLNLNEHVNLYLTVENFSFCFPFYSILLYFFLFMSDLRITSLARLYMLYCNDTLCEIFVTQCSCVILLLKPQQQQVGVHNRIVRCLRMLKVMGSSPISSHSFFFKSINIAIIHVSFHFPCITSAPIIYISGAIYCQYFQYFFIFVKRQMQKLFKYCAVACWYKCDSAVYIHV